MYSRVNCAGVLMIFLFGNWVRNCHCNPLVRQTANGPVEGIERTTVLGKKYYAFRGVPYAEVPITGIDPYTGEKIDRKFKV